MTNTTADITVSRTLRTTTYANNELAIILATVQHHHGDWRTCCYYGPEPEECDTSDWATRSVAEKHALRHTQAVSDAL
jgi:hypothetical protein